PPPPSPLFPYTTLFRSCRPILRTAASRPGVQFNLFMTKLEGVYPILNTTFHDDGSLDLASQAGLVEHLLEAGAHGLGLFGNASRSEEHTSELQSPYDLV